VEVRRSSLEEGILASADRGQEIYEIELFETVSAEKIDIFGFDEI